jgi:hypothetical protein
MSEFAGLYNIYDPYAPHVEEIANSCTLRMTCAPRVWTIFVYHQITNSTANHVPRA